MRKIALTGGPATGKTTLLNILKDLGYPTFSADEVVRKLVSPGGRAYEKFRALCSWAVEPDGTLNRKKILKRLVKDASFRAKLQSLLHPLVKEELLVFFKKNAEAKVIFAEIPLLFEVGWEDLFDEVWVIEASAETQKKRLLERVGEKELAEALMALQLPLSEKKKRASCVFSSEKPLEVLKKEVQEELSRILAPASESP